MTWQLFRSMLSFLSSVCSIVVALYIAYRARQLTQQQRDIAEQGRRIAQDKLEMDIFERKFKIYLTYAEFFSNLTDPTIETHESLNKCVHKYFLNKSNREIFFEGEDLEKIKKIGSNLEELLLFRGENISINEMNNEILKKFIALKNNCIEDSKVLVDIIQAHSPKNLKKRPSD